MGLIKATLWKFEYPKLQQYYQFDFKVRVADLADINITNYGSIHRYGIYYQRTAPLEIFYNGEPLRLARWPNQVLRITNASGSFFVHDCFSTLAQYFCHWNTVKHTTVIRKNK